MLDEGIREGIRPQLLRELEETLGFVVAGRGRPALHRSFS
jgi:hypothetical protein